LPVGKHRRWILNMFDKTQHEVNNGPREG
jgi:hypothetical protein